MTGADIIPRLLGARQEFLGAIEGLRQVLRWYASHANEAPPGSTIVLKALSDAGFELEFETIEKELQAFINWMQQLQDDPEGAPTEGPPMSTLTSSFLDEGRRTIAGPEPSQLLLRAVLPMAVGAFEVFVGETIRAALQQWPGLMGSSEKEFSLDDLRRLRDITAAEDELLQRKVDSILAQGLDGWRKWIAKDPLTIDLSRLSDDWDAFSEVFQRRHLVVHTGARTSARYLRATGAEADAAHGVEVPLDAEYVSSALDQIATVSHLLWVMAERKLAPSATRYVYGLSRSDLRMHLNEERWQVTTSVAGRLMKLTDTTMDFQVQMRVYDWYARSHLSEAEALNVGDEIAAFDASALGRPLVIQLRSLSGDHEAALAGLRAALQAKELSVIDIAVSPILRGYLSAIAIATGGEDGA